MEVWRCAPFFPADHGQLWPAFVCFASFTGRNLRGGKQEARDTEVESSTKSASARSSAHSTDLIRASRQSGSGAEVTTGPVTRAMGGRDKTGDGWSGGKAGGGKRGGGGGSGGKSAGKVATRAATRVVARAAARVAVRGAARATARAARAAATAAARAVVARAAVARAAAPRAAAVVARRI
jgi:hypothetical protein